MTSSVQCKQDVWVLGRRDRDYISWPVTNVPLDAAALISLEGDSWVSLVVSDGAVTGYFAGPDYVNPSPAIIVQTTSHVEIRIVTGGIDVVFDGGFIQLG